MKILLKVPILILALINHSVSEFVVDFMNVMPGVPKAKVKSRIILTPQHAKRFSKALNDNISRFERSNGVIKEYENQKPIQFKFWSYWRSLTKILIYSEILM